MRWPCKFAALGKISTFVSKQTNAFRLVWDGRGPLATLLLEEDRAEGLLVQDHTQAAAKRMPKSSASSSALETYGRGQQRLYDESQLASSSVANRTREDANEVEVEQQHEQNQQQAIDLQWEQQAIDLHRLAPGVPGAASCSANGITSVLTAVFVNVRSAGP